MDSVSEARLQLLYPKLAEKARTLADALKQENIIIRIVQGLRSWNDQDKLYAQGRTAPGLKVTNAPGGHSWHNFGLAIDVCPDLIPDDNVFTPDWDSTHPAWKRIWEVGTSLGLTSGALWRSRPDLPHFELVGRFPEAGPDDEVRQLFKDGGMQAVWAEVDKSS